MGFDDTEFDRLLSGRVPADDPSAGKVSAFLGNLDAACPPRDVSALEDQHLARIASEVRAVSAARIEARRRTPAGNRLRRTLAAAGTALVVALTAGVGAAAAMGVNPLQLVPDLLMKPWASPTAPEPTNAPTDGQPGSPVTQPPSVDPSVPPATTGRPSVSPTHGATGNCGNGKGEGNATCTNGNSGKENPGKPTAKPTKSNHGKAPGRPTTKPTPPPPSHGKGKDDSGSTPTP